MGKGKSHKRLARRDVMRTSAALARRKERQYEAEKKSYDRGAYDKPRPAEEGD